MLRRSSQSVHGASPKGEREFTVGRIYENGGHVSTPG